MKDKSAHKPNIGTLPDITERIIDPIDDRIDVLNTIDTLFYWWFQPTTNSCHYSRGFCEQTGQHREIPENPEEAWRFLIHPEALESFQEAVASLKAGKKDRRSTQLQIRNADGTWTWYEARFHRAPAAARVEPPSILVIFEDISEEKQAEQSLKEKNTQLLFALDSSEQALWDLDFKTGTTFYSPSWSTMLGYTPGEITNEADTWQKFVHPEDLPAVLEADRAHIAGKTENFRAEFRMRHKDGHWVWVLDRAKVVERDSAGNPLRMIGTHTDITQRINTLTLLEESQRQAEQAAQAKTDFLSNMSHELRTPLTSILGISDVLLEELGDVLSRRYVAALKTQKEAGTGLLAIVNDILDFNKLDAGVLAIEKIRFSLPDQLATAFQIIETSASDKGIEAALHLAPQCPEEVTGDPMRLRQVLINLLSNAIKFTPTGGQVCLEVRMNDAGQTVFKVTDTGFGIEPERLPHLFQRFTQADTSTTREYGGSGLGLAITQKLVVLMGGKIGVESVLNKGSAFTVTLPLQPGATAHDTHAGGAGASEVLSPGLASIRILLAEDNKVNQTLIKSRLQKAGAVVHAVSDGKTAVAAAQNDAFDIILMDIQMPHMGGVEASQLIRELGYHTGKSILALTANVYAEAEAAGPNCAIDAWLSKPVDWPKLFAAIREHTGRSQTAIPDAANQLPITAPQNRKSQDKPLSPQLQEMLDLVGPEETLQLADIFKEELRTRTAIINDHERDPATVSKEAHALASAAHSFGFVDLSNCCRDIMAVCEKAPTDLPSKIHLYRNLVSETLEQLSTMSRDLQSP